MNATHLWSHWQGLFAGFSHCFTVPGSKRFVEWITGLCLNVEEHTITQSVTAIERIGDWKALETFAETGAWDGQAVEDAEGDAGEHQQQDLLAHLEVQVLRGAQHGSCRCGSTESATITDRRCRCTGVGSNPVNGKVIRFCTLTVDGVLTAFSNACDRHLRYTRNGSNQRLKATAV